MKAKIYTKEGKFTDARSSLKRYMVSHKDDQGAKDLLNSIKEAEKGSDKISQAIQAQLWTACQEMAGQVLKTASHSLTIREQRAECALAAGDIEGAVGDYT
jgi:DnaJ family protein C protein 3